MNAWVYPQALYSPEHKVFMSFVQLHPHASTCFRVDMFQSEHTIDILSQVQAISNDSVVIGYPYYLVKADELARVGNDEMQFVKMHFYQQFDSLTQNQLKEMESTLNIHDILDSLKY